MSSYFSRDIRGGRFVGGDGTIIGNGHPGFNRGTGPAQCGPRRRGGNTTGPADSSGGGEGVHATQPVIQERQAVAPTGRLGAPHIHGNYPLAATVRRGD